jgi:hypothetical protein
MTPEPWGQHGRQQGAVQSHGRHQVLVQFLRPLRIVQGRKAAPWRARAAEHIDEHVDAAPLLDHRLRHRGRALGRREIGGDVAHAFGRMRGHGARRGHDPHTGFVQSLHNCSAYASRSARDQRAPARQLKIEAHAVISSDAIRPRSRPKW